MTHINSMQDDCMSEKGKRHKKGKPKAKVGKLPKIQKADTNLMMSNYFPKISQAKAPFETFFSQRLFELGLLVLALLLTAVSASAKFDVPTTNTNEHKAKDALYFWQSPVPDPFAKVGVNASQIKTLTASGTLFYPQPEKSIELNFGSKTQKLPATFVTGSVLLDAPVHKVKAVLTDYKNYPTFFPKLVSADVLSEKPDLAKVSYRAVIDMPVPVLKFDETFVLRHQVKDNVLATWIEDSPVKYGMGEFRWYNAGGGKTLLTLTQWGYLDDMRGLVLPVIIKAMPELKLAIPHSVNGYVLESLRLKFNGKDAPKTYTADDITTDWHLTKATAPTVKKLLKHTGKLPLLYAHAPRTLKGETDLRFVSSLQYVPAPQDELSALIFDPKRYPDMIKQVKSVTLTPKGKGQVADTKIGVGLGVISIPFNAKIYFEKTAADKSEFRAAGGDVRWIYGRYKTYPNGKNKSLLATTFANKTDENAPFLLRISHNLPYHDYLGSMGAAPILTEKVKQTLVE